MSLSKKLIDLALSHGATRAAVIDTNEIKTDPIFRKLCEDNACGKYGKCWVCPPHLGEYDELCARLKEFDKALVCQTVSTLEDSFDYEGMIDAKRRHYHFQSALQDDLPLCGEILHLGCGGCGLCKECAILQNEPCRFPDKAMPGLEAYNINVSALAKSAGMNYINGENTVTYFSAVLFKDQCQN